MINVCTNCHKTIWYDGPPCCDDPKPLHTPQPCIIGPGIPLDDQRGNGSPIPQEAGRDFLTERGFAR